MKRIEVLKGEPELKFVEGGDEEEMQGEREEKGTSDVVRVVIKGIKEKFPNNLKLWKDLKKVAQESNYLA